MSTFSNQVKNTLTLLEMNYQFQLFNFLNKEKITRQLIFKDILIEINIYVVEKSVLIFTLFYLENVK